MVNKKISIENETKDAMISDEDILAFQDPKFDRKTSTLPTAPVRRPRLGPIFTSVSQRIRYITIDGIISDTSYQEIQWPEFALKELADNSYEFLLVNYPDATAEVRKISTRLKIDTTTYPLVKILRIAVRNSNPDNHVAFPDIRAIFDYDRWGSTKRSQHRMTAGGLGDFLKRVLGMGYASWTATNNGSTDDSFEDKQWPEPVILRFNGIQYQVFLVVSGDKILPPTIDGPVTINSIGTDTEVQVALPLVNCWTGNYENSLLLKRLEKYYKTFKLIKRNIDFSFTSEVV